MSAEIVNIFEHEEFPTNELRQGVDVVLAILRAIDFGELLVALPDCEVAQVRHGTAMALLAAAERQVLALRDVLGASG
jgi:hypothetical protein